jgi:tRNA 2-thiouridine synthesizing protein D
MCGGRVSQRVKQLKFALQVNSPPYSSQGSETAYRFARAATQLGHEVNRVFFYFDGVYNALGYSAPPDDEKNVVGLWTTLAAKKNIDLVVCVSAVQRRGWARMESDKESLQGLIANGFRISGLGQWVDAAIEADRTLTFGGGS